VDKKLLILETALKLFNQHGTKAISTNHIAKEAGISPGNLYYHFKNKEAIIYALYLQMQEEIGFEEAPLPISLCELKNYCEYVATIWWRYRFFRKELMTLIEGDPTLAQKVISDNRAQKKKLEQLIEHLHAQGYITEANQHLSFLIMMLSQFWMPLHQLMGEPIEEKEALEVSEAVIMTLQPFLTQKAFEELHHCKGA